MNCRKLSFAIREYVAAYISINYFHRNYVFFNNPNTLFILLYDSIEIISVHLTNIKIIILFRIYHNKCVNTSNHHNVTVYNGVCTRARESFPESREGVRRACAPINQLSKIGVSECGLPDVQHANH